MCAPADSCHAQLVIVHAMEPAYIVSRRYMPGNIRTVLDEKYINGVEVYHWHSTWHPEICRSRRLLEIWIGLHLIQHRP